MENTPLGLGSIAKFEGEGISHAEAEAYVRPVVEFLFNNIEWVALAALVLWLRREFVGKSI